jgi:hypothetical protein
MNCLGDGSATGATGFGLAGNAPGEAAVGAACTATASSTKATPLAKPEKMTRHKICMNEDMVWKF